MFRETTASIDVDAQKGFTPVCPDELPVLEGDQIVDALNTQATFAKYRIGTKDAHCREALHIATEKEPQFTPVGASNTDIKWNQHCIMGTKGAELLDGLPHPLDYDFFVWKGIEPDVHVYGACYHDLAEKLSTGLIEWLNSKEVKTVLVGGLALDFCIRNTVMQLVRANFKVYLNLEGTRGISEESMNSAMTEMVENGVVMIGEAERFADFMED